RTAPGRAVVDPGQGPTSSVGHTPFTSKATTKSLSCAVAWPGTSPFTITRGCTRRWATEPRRRSPGRRCLGTSGYPGARTGDNLDVSRCGADPRSGAPPPSVGARTRVRATAKAVDDEPIDDGRDPRPLGHRAGQPEGGRAAPAAGLRGAPPAGRPEAGPREARPDAPGHGAGPRGLSPIGRYRTGPAVERPD